ncbi:hypothetical protein TEA_008802 [Camellia sinensis var. sinensis]|uniref:Endoplasmic reticulum transmembrane protein n=1 Tax=Camellia sinensis var. sinensis TaxID=542762 RepID=A0A4V3WLA0_CAMSN|nr:hypothetical protein TEA_008802 [Camellia sinensis var. sinensis]
MIQLLLPLVLIEMGLTVILVFDTPVIRKLVMMGLDRVKQGRGPLMAKTVAGTLFVVFISSLYGVMTTQKRMMETGSVNPTDEVLLATNLLEASIMGINFFYSQPLQIRFRFSLFLGLIIDRLHYHIKELHLLNNNLDEAKQQLLGYNNLKSRGVDETKVLKKEVSVSSTKDKPLKSENKIKLQEADPKTIARL